MEMHRLPPSIRRVTVLAMDADGAVMSRTVYEKRGQKRKVSPALRPLERAIRRVARANDAATSSYVARHERSTAKKRDGWLRDLTWNVLKAEKTGVKKLKLDR
jgi:hypothetical protein